ncbi:hypothetical protein SCHPADRAFT_826983, partial [Schizopora paradoxa]
DTSIPPPTESRHRTLVLCFDGIGADDNNSNIVQFFSMLNKGDSDRQLCYYQGGVSTHTTSRIVTSLWSKLTQTVDLMIANSLDYQVIGGYRFLMENYKEGDKICIFGVSRGAYAARALAGMIHKVGLLPNSNHQQVPFAYQIYMRDDEKGWKQSVLFKKTFSIDAYIQFVGVWDTVASVGLIGRRLPFVKSNTAIKTFRHALSLDEHRAMYKPNFVSFSSTSTTAFSSTKSNSSTQSNVYKYHGLSWDEDEWQREEETSKKRIDDQNTDRNWPTDVLEVWFAGSQRDVGGGAVTDNTQHSLARIPLRWMIRQCFATDSGIQFQVEKLCEIGLDPASLYPYCKDRPPPIRIPDPPPLPNAPARNGKQEKGNMPPWAEVGDVIMQRQKSEEEEELLDALCPMYDPLEMSHMWWWLLECLPISQRVHQPDGTWTTSTQMNLGRPRELPGQELTGISVHRSVKTRMEAKHLNYTPRLKFDVEPEWVD